jgi:hypothetical protein
MSEEEIKPPEGELQKDLRNASTREEVWEAVKKAIANLVYLEIRTRVTNGDGDKEIYTKIDLFQSDRTNKIHIDFVKDNDLAELRNFHTEQVKLAELDIQKKLEFLRNLANTFIEAFERAKPPSG